MTATTRAHPALGLAELSGLTASVLHPGVIWVVEDSGEPVVKAFDGSGAQVGSVLFEASDVFAGDNRDTESLAMGPGPTLWSADIGDNSALRETVLVHTAPEPVALAEQVVTATSYRFRYPDGPRDAEAFLVDPVDGRAYIATKGLLGDAGWYAAPAVLDAGGTHDLSRVQDLPALLTGGEFSPDGSLVALRTLGFDSASVALLYDVVRHATGEPVKLTIRAEVTLPEQLQGEALGFTTDGTALLVGSEGTAEPIWSVALPPELLAPATPTDEPAEPPSEVPVAASSSPTGAGAPPAAACGLGEPAACAGSTAGWVAIAAGCLALLGGAIVALGRRRK